MISKPLIRMCGESKPYIILNILFQWCELFSNGLVVFALIKILSHLKEFHFSKQGIWIFLIIIALLIKIPVTLLANRMSFLAAKSVKKKLRNRIYLKLLRIGGNYRKEFSTGELVQKSVEGVEQLESYFGLYLPQFFYAFIAPVTLFFIFGFVGTWSVATILLVCVPLIPVSIIVVQKIAKRLFSKYWGQYTKLGSSFLENLQGMTTLKIFQADEERAKKMDKESKAFRDVTMRVLTMQLNSIIVMDSIAYGGAAIGIVLATLAVLKGTIGFGQGLFMILLSAEFFLPMRKLGSYFHVAMNGMAASETIFSFLNSKEEAVGIEKVDDPSISISKLSFSYDGKRDILNSINFSCARGEFVGIVGESGCGKSTLAKMILGHEKPTCGTICIGSKEQSTISRDEFMKQFCYISHNPFFFKGTIKENLLLGNSNVKKSKLVSVLKECGLEELLKKDHWDELELLENASNLSGGQRQRLALARALLHDAQTYIFDEATSNIDVESEFIILSQIEKLRGKKSLIVITHRLANVVHANKIICMKSGKIVEEGSHETLLKKNGHYANLWKNQQVLENFSEEELR